MKKICFFIFIIFAILIVAAMTDMDNPVVLFLSIIAFYLSFFGGSALRVAMHYFVKLQNLLDHEYNEAKKNQKK